VGSSSKRVALTIAGALFMEGFDSSVMLTSLPQIARDLGERPLALSAAVTAYLLALAVFIPVSGWTAERFGARRVYCTAIGIFLCGSLACGWAQSSSALIFGRFVQGTGGAMMAPVGRVIVARSAGKHELIAVMSFMLIPGLLGAALGPLVGGFITTYASWRWNFFINIPVGVLGITLALRWIAPSSADRHLRFDYLGFVLIGAAASSLQLACELPSRSPHARGLPVSLGILAALLSGAYLLHARRSPDAIFPLTLFRVRTFSVSILAGGLARTGVFAPQFLLPTLLQIQFGFNAFRAGSIVALMACGSFVMRPGLSYLLRRVGFRRWLFCACTVAGIQIAGFGLFTRNTPMLILAPYVLLFGVVRSALFSSLGALSLADIEQASMGKSTSAALLTQRLSMSLGVSLAATTLELSSRGRRLGHGDFATAFAAGALATLVAAWGMRFLRENDGWRVSGRNPVGDADSIKDLAP
jgi:EmrB/QacA subfamily drug resistance transporter